MTPADFTAKPLRQWMQDDDPGQEARCTLEFVRLTPGHWPPGTQRQAALEIAALFDGFFHALNKVAQAVAAGAQCAKS